MLNKIWPFSTINKYRNHAKVIAWMCRASFELGYRANGDPDGWRDVWKASKPRATLLDMGYIKEDDTWR